MELMTSHRNYQWLHNLVTGDEKWVLYINYEYHRQWVSPGQTGVVTPRGVQLTLTLMSAHSFRSRSCERER